MAKIASGNWNDLPWRDSPRKIVNGVSKLKQCVFGFECQNLLCTICEIQNGSPKGPHTHPHEQIALVLQGECDYYVDGVPYHLTAGSWVNVPPHVVHYVDVHDSPVPVLQMDIFSPGRPSTSDVYKEFLAQNGIDWDSRVKEMEDLTAPNVEGLETRA